MRRRLFLFLLRRDLFFQRAESKKQPLLICDIGAGADVNVSGWAGYNDGTALVFPLAGEAGEIAGILTLHNKITPEFGAQDKEVGSILASYSCEALRAVRASGNLRENERQFRAILDNIRIGIIIEDVHTMKIVYVNPTAAEMIGESADKIIDGKCKDVLCLRDEKCRSELDSGREVDTSEGILKTADGRQIPILKTVSHTVYYGRECLLESFIDLTAQKQAAEEKTKLEAQLRQAQKLKALGELAGGVAHDFNNMLAGIMGATELLDYTIGDNSDTKEYIDMIISTTDRASDLIRKLLAFSRRSDTVATAINCHDVINDSISILKHSIDKRIAIITDLTARNSIVMADVSALMNAFINLGVNAGNAMPDGGQIRFYSENLHLKDDAPEMARNKLKAGPYIKISIEDTGCGMPPEVQERIFEPFFTTKEQGQGTGLGLAAVYGTVREIRGVINVHSEIGHGTVFHLLFPLVGKIDSDSTPAVSTTAYYKNATVLVVDDDEIIRKTSIVLLKELGHRVITANNGREGLAVYREHQDQIDVVLLDIVMPEMNGLECFRAIRAVNPQARVILSSGFSRSSYKEGIMNEKYCLFLKKPYSLQKMAETINNILSEK